MAPDRIRLVHLQTRTVLWQKVDAIPWDKVWTISHVWDRGGKITIPLEGVSWQSTSFSSENRFNIMFDRVHQVIKPCNAEYVWMDAACIDQDRDEEKVEQIPFMRTIYSESAGCVAFGTLSPDDRFVPVVSAYDGGRKAWVCDWFERVWTLQELQLPKVLLFLSGDQILTRNELYLWVLMMSPYLTPRYPSSPLRPEDPSLSIHDILNILSPSSRTNTQRALMQTSKRGCSTLHIHDKVYGILGVLSQSFAQLTVDYDITLVQALLNLLKLMPSKDVLDTLTFNKLPVADDVHDAIHWSGMVALDGPVEHPSYEKDIYHPTNAHVSTTGDTSRACTVIDNAPLWKVMVASNAKPEDSHAASAESQVPPWPSIAIVSQYIKLTDDFSGVERSAEYADVVGRVGRSLAANWTLLEPLLEKATGGASNGLFSPLQNMLSTAKGSSGLPQNRLGDESLFDQEVTVLVCRSKSNNLFHYGIVVKPNEDGTWHKVCTASFSASCVMATRIESSVVIGK